MKEQKIELSGKSVWFSYGIGFLGEYLESTDLGLDELMLKLTKNPFKYIPDLMYQSANYHAMLNKEKEPHTLDSIILDIEETGGINGPACVSFLDGLTKSLFQFVPESDQQETTEPKKK